MAWPDSQVSRHTCRATHGKPAIANAHPHFSPDADAPRIAVPHNGINENHEALRAPLGERGYFFATETDSEVIANLIDLQYTCDLFEAVKRAILQLMPLPSFAATSRTV